MALPSNAKVEAAPNFLANLDAAHQFFQVQDDDSAQARLKANGVLQLAQQAGLPHLREVLVGQHLVLYAHSEAEAVLLAIKHQRQLVYATDGQASLATCR